MRFLLKCLLLIALCQSTPIKLQAQINAVIPGDFADPSIIKKGNQYYAVGTSSEWAPHFPIFQSANLKNWKQVGYVFDKAPEWTTGSFWAPEYYYHNNTYFIYYSARRKKDNASYIGVATSPYPDRGFKDHGVIIEHSKESIDAFVYNDNGQLYITFKAYGLDGRPIEIMGSKLSADGLKLEGELFTMLKDEKGIGLEGQSFLKKDNYYYMFYSAGNCCGSNCDYNTRIARSKTFKGPYEDYENNPVLKENEDWKCSGHGTFVNTPDHKTYYLYHAYNKQSSVYTGRQGLLAELIWPGTNAWPVFKTETSGTQPANIKDDFKAKMPAVYWQWDFRNSNPVVKQLKGNLHLSGITKEDYLTGIAYTVRPVSTNYEITTTVVNHNDAQKGLVIYGDANAAIGVGTVGNKVEFWMVKDKKRTVLASEGISSAGPVELKLEVQPDFICRVYFKQSQKDWRSLTAAQAPSVNFLPPWDRSPRIGLNFKGSANQEAQFSSFQLINK
ncbi:glycoside hydrolase family 43 protein [Pedobacter frigoris]|uniref:Beta-xylosidase n=1 Tax=Pedobacter frigoris TaxID=2571272 RepID=A0A4U1CNN8_9SPHI|nr:glycoside hydrolase family 43 protein [Pedobacter frigoris]TKC09063.1 beta-xylosidase [Pedobacter frigoris]